MNTAHSPHQAGSLQSWFNRAFDNGCSLCLTGGQML